MLTADTPTRPTAPEEESRRTAIIRAAGALFKERGFNGTTVRDIADAVGILSGSLFYHFANKQQILFAVMEDGLRRGKKMLAEALVPGGDPAENFRRLLRAHLQVIHGSDNDFIAALASEWRHLSPENQIKLVAVKDDYEKVMQDTIAALEERGLVKGDVALVRLLVFGALNFTVNWYRPNGSLSIDEIADEAARVFLGQ